MDQKQGELPLKRRRIKLEEGEGDRRFGQPHHGHAELEPCEMCGHPFEQVLLGKYGCPNCASEGLKEGAELGYTPWYTEERPSVPGYWEITDHETGTMHGRWWWSGAHWELPEISLVSELEELWKGETTRNFMGHESFKAAFAWRGLKEPPPEGYPIPPYNAMMFVAPGRVLPRLYAAGTKRRKLEA